MFNLMNKGSLLVSPFQGRRFMNLHNSKHSDCSLFLYNKHVTKKMSSGRVYLNALLCLDSCILRSLSLMNMQRNLSLSLSCPYCSLLTAGKYYLLHKSSVESASTCCSPHTAISNCKTSESSWQGYRSTRNTALGNSSPVLYPRPIPGWRLAC